MQAGGRGNDALNSFSHSNSKHARALSTFASTEAGQVLLNPDLDAWILEFCRDEEAMRMMASCSGMYGHRRAYPLKSQCDFPLVPAPPSVRPSWLDCIIKRVYAKVTTSISELGLPSTVSDLLLFHNADDGLAVVDAPLPPCLRDLHLTSYRHAISLPSGYLPSSLTSLFLECCIHLRSDHLPSGLQELVLMNAAFSKVEFPSTLVSLDLESADSEETSLDGVVWPPALQTLFLPETLTPPVPLEELTLPSSLTTLQLSASPVSEDGLHRLPPSLRTLKFPYYFNSSVGKLNLPAGLTALEFGHEFNQSVDELRLPPLLARLYFAGKFSQPLFELCQYYPNQCPGIIRLSADIRYLDECWEKFSAADGSGEFCVRYAAHKLWPLIGDDDGGIESRLEALSPEEQHATLLLFSSRCTTLQRELERLRAMCLPPWPDG